MKLFKKQLFWTVLEIWIYDEEIDENDAVVLSMKEIIKHDGTLYNVP